MDTSPQSEPLEPMPFAGTSARFQTLLVLSEEAFLEQAYDTAYLCLNAAFSDALRAAQQTDDHTALVQVEDIALRYVHLVGQEVYSPAGLPAVTVALGYRALSYLVSQTDTDDPADDDYGDMTVFPFGFVSDAVDQEEENTREWDLLLRSEGYLPLQNTADPDDSPQDAAAYDDFAVPANDGDVPSRNAEEWAALVCTGGFTHLPNPEDPDAADNASGDPLGEEEIPFALQHPDAPDDLHSLHYRLANLFFFLLYPEAEDITPEARQEYGKQREAARPACERKASQARELMGRYLGNLLTNTLTKQPEPLSSDTLLNFWATLALELQDRRPRE